MNWTGHITLVAEILVGKRVTEERLGVVWRIILKLKLKE
jgi:hypothetical protein